MSLPRERLKAPAASALASPERLAAITKGLTTSRAHLRAAKENELEAKRRVLRMQRELTHVRSESALKELHDKRREGAQSLRADMDALKRALVGVAAASEDQVRELAGRMHSRMCELITDPLARGWFRLFKHMDDDGSGKVSFAEFEDLVRNELLLGGSELPDEALKSAWVALDDDGSGYITAGEFGGFMRKGEVQQKSTWKSRVEAKKRAAGDEVRAWRKAKQNSTLQAVASQGGYEANEQEVRTLAELMRTRLAEIHDDPAKRSWFKLFKRIDDDGSGRLSYAEFVTMIETELQLKLALDRDEHDAAMLAIWLAIDRDGSGFITAGEFGGFMRKGEPRSSGWQERHAQERAEMAARERYRADRRTERYRAEMQRQRSENVLRVRQVRESEARAAAWRQRVEAERRAAGDAVRATVDNRELRAALRSIGAASDGEVRDVAAAMHGRMRELQRQGFVEHDSAAWFRLFKHMDDDGSGKVSFAEFEDLVRNELLLGVAELPEPSLKAVWVALDDDGSGYITVGEFGKFMRRGEAAHRERGEGKKRLEEGNRRKSDAVRAKRQMRELKDSLLGIDAADGALCCEVAALMHARMRELNNAKAGGSGEHARHDSWFRLFKHMDDDGSGKVSFAEFEDLVRNELLLGVAELPEPSLKAVWVALDDDGSGYITVKEFGVFMRRGGLREKARRDDNLTRRRELGQQAKGEVARGTTRLAKMQLNELKQSARKLDDEAKALERKIAAARSGEAEPTPEAAPPPIDVTALPARVADGVLLSDAEMRALRDAAMFARSSPSRRPEPRQLAPLEPYQWPLGAVPSPKPLAPITSPVKAAKAPPLPGRRSPPPGTVPQPLAMKVSPQRKGPQRARQVPLATPAAATEAEEPKAAEVAQWLAEAAEVAHDEASAAVAPALERKIAAARSGEAEPTPEAAPPPIDVTALPARVADGVLLSDAEMRALRDAAMFARSSAVAPEPASVAVDSEPASVVVDSEAAAVVAAEDG